MARSGLLLWRSVLLLAVSCVWGQAGPAPGPFVADEHTVALYDLDEGEGTVVRDASGNGQDGVVQGAQWAEGRFGSALWFDGTDDSVFVAAPDSIRDLRRITVECWFNPEYASGRRFLIGHDVGFHFEVDEGTFTSISLYNQGGAVPNEEGKPHQQVGLAGGLIRSGRWHHLAITYGGGAVSYFLDGVLRGRQPGPKAFRLGAPSRGLWLGCYVGQDFYYSGRIDEARVSDCVRYDAEGKLQPGETVFDMPRPTHPFATATTPEMPTGTGDAFLGVTVRKRYGGEAWGQVYIKPPSGHAHIVGDYRIGGDPGTEAQVRADVSDVVLGEGTYIVGLEQSDPGAYVAVTRATIEMAGRKVDEWEGELLSRKTFDPPMLIPLSVGEAPARRGRWQFVLTPDDVDRASGTLEMDTGAADQPPLLIGDGKVEWWFTTPETANCRVSMRYAASAPRPCDLVIDGRDLHPYNMAARNATGLSTAQDALWEYQGSTVLEAGAHWLRIQDVLPDVVAIRLDFDTEGEEVAPVPWGRFGVPAADLLGDAATWQPHAVFGRPESADAGIEAGALRFSARFPNTDAADLFAGDCVRFARMGQWDLEPFGRLTMTVQGQNSGHVASLVAVDAKGDEKLLWRWRDRSADPQAVTVPLSFEGNDVFDPSRVRMIAFELDEGNVSLTDASEVRITIVEPRLERRDVLLDPEGYGDAVRAAVDALRGLLGGGRADMALQSAAFRPWVRPVVPEEHPLFAATEPKPVTRATLGYDLHFTGTRDVSPGSLDDFHRHYDFGDVCWPHIGILPQRRDLASDELYAQALAGLQSRLEDVRDRGLLLFDIWGYVPNNEAGPTPRVTPEHHEILQRVLGDRFLGYDNGEQDGRYIGSYADRGTFTDRRGGWDDFVRWDEGICGDSMNYMNATGSLNFSHYYAERGCRTLGLETAQGLPSDTLMFAFLRGAGKQYGRLTTQATSIWNRYGYNLYNDRQTNGANGYGLGPNKGCSLSLHKRLFLASYTGGDSIVGSETGQFTADRLESGAPELSPLGKQHLEIRDWVRRHPDRGVMYTPVAFMLDFYNGWNIPRHLYRSDKYKIWGKLPYEKGDYLTDAVFRMVWPGYEDCSYLRNERGFITPTPYGDIFDVITNRCRPEVLQQYSSIMLMGDVELTPEVIENLTAFVRAGGDLLLDARHAALLPADLMGLSVGEHKTGCSTGLAPSGDAYSERPYTYSVLARTSAQPLVINEAGDAVLTVNTAGAGRVIVCAADYWLTDPLTYAEPQLVNMEPPYRLLEGVRAALDGYFASFLPVETEPAGLNVRVNCYDADPKRLLVTLTNNDLFADWRGTVRTTLGTIASAAELWTGEALPTGDSIGVSVPAGDVRLIDVRLR